MGSRLSTPSRRARIVLVWLAVVALGVGVAGPADARTRHDERSYYLSLGDSLAYGYQPNLVAAGDLDPYVGSYQLAPGHTMRIERQGDRLVSIGRDHKPVPMLAEARDVLFRAGSPRVRFVFARNADGRITGFDVRRAGHDLQHFTRS